MQDNYNIKEGYLHREKEEYIDVTEGKDEAQDEVYRRAYEISVNKKLSTISDLGCGSGFKLIKYFSNYKTIGYDLKQTVDKLINRYPENNWVEINYQNVPEKTDLVICADVIEHVLYPNILIEYILKMEPKYVVMSTPDRNTLGQWGRLNGPPFNPYHIREWSKDEFKDYISRWFKIEELQSVPQSGYEYMLMILKPKFYNQ